ncbi:hypothetical protein [Ornithinimicrobium sediminis]|uniref:hypothetical protein n=1 Tax=Ornithinimicrobium sediminis TaxID=2904603 RepID=UPI001E32784B|nr:hypothetical protein [Ornithinimicrobium sediminis]MCE0485483.1 hypothetical protein [Ornithinimicrobium sediminis]
MEQPQGDLLVSACAKWGQWQQTHPVLGVCDELMGLREWIKRSGPGEANEVLLALAELGATDGGDDPAATAALLWLLLPGAVGIAQALMSAHPHIDELVAGQLWICARTVSWRKGVWVAATVLLNTRREVMSDLGLSMDPRADGAEFPSADPELLTGPGLSGHPVGGCGPQTVAAAEADLLHGLLEDARGAGVVSADDCQLLLRLAQHACTRRSGRGRGGLFARASSVDVAQEYGVSRATVARRGERALRALQDTYATGVRVA